METILELFKSWITQAEEEKKKNTEDLEKEENEEKKEEIRKRRDPVEVFNKLPNFIYEFVHFRSFFFDYLHIYGTAFASMTGSPN